MTQGNVESILTLTAIRQRRGVRRANTVDGQHGESIEEDQPIEVAL